MFKWRISKYFKIGLQYLISPEDGRRGSTHMKKMWIYIFLSGVDYKILWFVELSKSFYSKIKFRKMIQPGMWLICSLDCFFVVERRGWDELHPGVLNMTYKFLVTSNQHNKKVSLWKNYEFFRETTKNKVSWFVRTLQKLERRGHYLTHSLPFKIL